MDITPGQINEEDWNYLIQRTKDMQEQKYLDGLKIPITIKCVVCDIIIQPDSHDPNDKLAEEYANHTSFSNGAVGTISFGYGCRFDTDVFIIGICEHCYEKKLKSGGVLFTRSYMP